VDSRAIPGYNAGFIRIWSQHKTLEGIPWHIKKDKELPGTDETATPITGA
jgi:hypothetical protein